MGRLVPRKHACGDPAPQVCSNFERRGIATQPVTIQKPCKQLVHGVPRHPCLRFDIEFSAFDVVELRFGIPPLDRRRRPQKAGLSFAAALTFPKPVHHADELPSDLFAFVREHARIAGRLRERGEIVSRAMPRDQLVFPAAVADVWRRNARVFIKSGKKPPDIERQ